VGSQEIGKLQCRTCSSYGSKVQGIFIHKSRIVDGFIQDLSVKNRLKQFDSRIRNRTLLKSFEISLIS